MLRPYKQEVLRSGNGASLSRGTGNFWRRSLRDGFGMLL